MRVTDRSYFELQRLETLASGPEIAELIDRCADGRERKRLEWSREHRIQERRGSDADGNVRQEVLARVIGDERRDVLDRSGVDVRLGRRREQRSRRRGGDV